MKGSKRSVIVSNNIKMCLADMKELSFEKQHDRFYVHLDMFSDIDEILFRLKGIPGIHNFSLVKKINKDIDLCINFIKIFSYRKVLCFDHINYSLFF